MSQALIRAAFETALAAITPSIATAYENAAFTMPAPSVPYQAAWLLTADPDNQEISSDYTERGLFQVNLQYPLNGGTAAAAARAQMIRDAFPRGRALTAGGIITTVTKTPSIGPGRAEADRWLIPVKVPFEAQIRS